MKVKPPPWLHPNSLRIAGIHCENQGQIAAVWLAHDKNTDRLGLYDCAVFRRDAWAVIAEGIKARGAWIPTAWREDDEPVIAKLKERRCAMFLKGYKESVTLAEVNARSLDEFMRTERFIVDKPCVLWQDEYRAFSRKDGLVPQEAFPLMSATRHAINFLRNARKRPEPRPKKLEYDSAGVV